MSFISHPWVESSSRMSQKTSQKNKSKSISKTIPIKSLIVELPKTKMDNPESLLSLGLRILKRLNKSEKTITILILEPLKFKLTLPNLWARLNIRARIKMENLSKRIWMPNNWTRSLINTRRLSRKDLRNLGKTSLVQMLTRKLNKNNKKMSSTTNKIKAKNNNWKTRNSVKPNKTMKLNQWKHSNCHKKTKNTLPNH